MNNKKKSLNSCIDCSFCIERSKENNGYISKNCCCTLQNNKTIYNISNNKINYNGKDITIDKNTEYPKCELGLWEKR